MNITNFRSPFGGQLKTDGEPSDQLCLPLSHHKPSIDPYLSIFKNTSDLLHPESPRAFSLLRMQSLQSHIFTLDLT